MAEDVLVKGALWEGIAVELGMAPCDRGLGSRCVGPAAECVLGAPVARCAANRGRKCLSGVRVLRNGNCRSRNEVDILPSIMRLLVGCGRWVG